MKTSTIIKCPKCGREYLMGEIFVGPAFVGKPVNIQRDSLGRITDYIGTDTDCTEYYICDECETPFKVEATISISATELTNQEFEEAVKPKITKQVLF